MKEREKQRKMHKQGNIPDSGSQVIDHMTRNKKKRETRLAGQILCMQACGKGMKNENK
jgi:hypothetical protein